MTLTQTVRNQLYNTIFSDLPIQSVFEVGVGNGEFAQWCKGRGLRYMGMDKEPTKVDNMVRWDFHCRYGVAPMIPCYPNMGSFDCVYAAHLIEHLKGYGEIMELIENCRRILKPEGYIIFLYPDIERCGFTFYYDYTHIYPTSKRRVEAIMKDAGLRIVRSDYYTGGWIAPAWLLHFLGRAIPFSGVRVKMISAGGYDFKSNAPASKPSGGASSTTQTGSKEFEMSNSSQSKMKEGLKEIILELGNGNIQEAANILEQLTSFDNKEGKTIKGKRFVDYLSDKALAVAYGKAKVKYLEVFGKEYKKEAE